MKKVVITKPIFTPSTSTIVTNIENFDIRKLYAIINQTLGVLLYATGTPGKGFIETSGSTIVLEFDTTSMNNDDVLQILYDDDEDTQLLQNIYEGIDLLGFLAGVRGPAANLRTTITDGVVTSVGTVSTVTTVSTVSNLAAIGTFGSQPIVPSTVNIGAIQSNINNIQINTI